MNTLLISYDLGGPETSASYEKLITAIKGIGANIHPLESLWLVKTNNSAEIVRDYLFGFLDANDSILVIGVTRDYATFLREEYNTWMNNNL